MNPLWLERHQKRTTNEKLEVTEVLRLYNTHSAHPVRRGCVSRDRAGLTILGCPRPGKSWVLQGQSRKEVWRLAFKTRSFSCDRLFLRPTQ